MRLLRAEAPIYFHKEPDGPGFWVVTKYEDVVTVGKDPGRFSSHRGGTNIQDYPPENLSTIQLMMLNMDPPQHNKFRRLVSQGFTPRMVARLEPHIREAARTIVDRIADKGECDFVRNVAAELPLQVIAELHRHPAGGPRQALRLVQPPHRVRRSRVPDVARGRPPGGHGNVDVRQRARRAGAKERKGEDLISVLMNAEVDGVGLTEMEFDAFFLLLAVAGNETTRNLISGGMLALIENPSERARLVADPSLIPSAVEEMLRWVTPVMYFRRTATRDTELRGSPIKENQKVCVYYTSANRDEDVFPEPFKFDVGRTPNEHLAFGVGAALLPRQQPGPPRDPRDVRGADAPLPGHRARRQRAPPAVELHQRRTSPSRCASRPRSAADAQPARAGRKP